MTEREALLRAILEDPADDTVRLVFADWLEENDGRPGAVRAKFIRDQIAGYVRSVPLTVLAELESFLPVQPHEYMLSIGDKGYATVDYPGLSVNFRRGFVEKVAFTWMDILCGNGCRRCRAYKTNRRCVDCGARARKPGIAEELFASQPVTEVVFTGMSPYLGGDGTHCCWFPCRAYLPETERTDRDLVEDVVFDQMRGESLEFGPGWVAKSSRTICRFRETDRAQDELSKAAVRYGRKLAGLKDLP